MNPEQAQEVIKLLKEIKELLQKQISLFEQYDAVTFPPLLPVYDPVIPPP